MAEQRQRELCDSGLRLPADGRLTDGVFDYARGHCGYVVRHLVDSPGGASLAAVVLDRHVKRAHPALWAEIDFVRRMSKD